jgi:acyl-CoA synthetase (AMP-forming)/AMP-acid ligase II/acyl carrier protein
MNTKAKFSTVVDLLRDRAQDEPDRVAYTFLRDGENESASLTYRELDLQAMAIAAQLQILGTAGERALLLYPPGLEFIAAFFGCLYAGVVAVPAYPPRRERNLPVLQAIAIDAQATAILSTKSLLTDLERRFGQNLDLPAMRWLATNTLPSYSADVWQDPLVNGDTLAFLQYTSGSTGTPKGVMVSHGNILRNSECIKLAFELTTESVSVTWLPGFHDMGLIDGIIQPLYAGFPGISIPPTSFLQQPIRWLQAISRYRATHCGGPNSGYELCIDKITARQLKNLDLSSWRSAYSGAEPVRRETLEKFLAKFHACGFQSRFFYPCYGMAESTLMISGGQVDREPTYLTVQSDVLEQKQQVVEAMPNARMVRQLVGCGQAWLDTKIVIVDPEFQTQCPQDQIGEIWVSGSSVALGYWQQVQETRQTFQATLAETGKGPFLRTGDLGFLRNGELFVTGRIKDVIIIWGRNHYPQDIEYSVQQSHPALRPSCGAAFSIEVNNEEQLVIAQEVERSYLRKLNISEVVRAIRQAVSEQHELQVYAVLLLKTASIPKTSSGKIQRQACKSLFLNGDLEIIGKWQQLPSQPQQQLEVGKSEELKPINCEQQQPIFSKVEGEAQILSKSSAPVPVLLTEEMIQDWLISHLATYLKILPEEIDIREPFACYGLDSSVAVSLTGELADWLGCELEITLLWEYPSTQKVARHLASQCQATRSLSQVSS